MPIGIRHAIRKWEAPGIRMDMGATSRSESDACTGTASLLTSLSLSRQLQQKTESTPMWTWFRPILQDPTDSHSAVGQDSYACNSSIPMSFNVHRCGLADFCKPACRFPASRSRKPIAPQCGHKADRSCRLWPIPVPQLAGIHASQFIRSVLMVKLQ